MIKVFEINLCMYLKTISPDVPRFTFVIFITDQYCSFKLDGLFIRFVKKLPIVRKFNVSVNDSKIKSYCLFPQSFSSLNIRGSWTK
jgi:hypothetical protein